jgi:hypothetical protein
MAVGTQELALRHLREEDLPGLLEARTNREQLRCRVDVMKLQILLSLATLTSTPEHGLGFSAPSGSEPLYCL